MRGSKHSKMEVRLESPSGTRSWDDCNDLEWDNSRNNTTVISMKRKRRRCPIYRIPSSQNTNLVLLLLCSILWSTCLAGTNADSHHHRLEKRRAILPTAPSGPLLVPFLRPPSARSAGSPHSYNHNEEDNQIDTLPGRGPGGNGSSGRVTFPSQSPSLVVFRESSPGFRFPDQPSVRESRNLEPQAQAATPDIFHLEEQQGVETGRKASPDVQDIIDGIVKLLGGKVHNQNQNQQQAAAAAPQLISSHRPYNLFNPTKPLFYPTPKPARINNRGPPVPIGQKQPEGQGQGQGGQQAFEAIPLEALNNNYNLNQTKFGPPFSLQHEAPYKQGVPLPVQVVPGPHVGNQGHGGFGFNRPANTNQHQPQNGHPGHPHQPHTGNPGNAHKPQNGHPGNAFQAQNGHPINSYQPPNGNPGNAYRPSNGNPEPAFQPQPNAYQPQNMNNYYPLSSAEGQPSNYNNVGAGAETLPHDEKMFLPTPRPTNNGHVGPSPNFQIPTRSPPPKVTSLLVPVEPRPKVPAMNSTGPVPPLQAVLHTDSFEDDEAEAERASQALHDKNTRRPFGLEPTISEESQVAGFSLDPSTSSLGSQQPTSTVYHFSSITATMAPATVSISPTSTSSVPIQPTATSSSNVGQQQQLEEATTLTPAPITTTTQGLQPELISSTARPKVPAFNPNNIGVGTSTSLGAISATPPLRPGIVIHEENPSTNPLQLQRPGAGRRPPGYGSVEVVTSEDQVSNSNSYGGGKVGDVFDITVTAKQNYGGQVTGQPFVIPVDLKDEIITAPAGNQQFVSIDGKRTYFSLHPSTAGIAAGSATPTMVGTVQGTVLPGPVPSPKSHPGIVGAPRHPFGPVSGATGPGPSRAVSTSLSITGTGNKNLVGATLKMNERAGAPPTAAVLNKSPPNIIRRPLTRRPSVPPVRIDTCIVGDDSTCNSDQHESCRTESGVSSCICRPGFARKRHREPCKAVVSLVLSIRLDRLGDKKLSYNPDYFNPNSEIYQSLEWETIHGLDSALSETSLQGSYIGAKLDAIGFDGRHAVVNSTVILLENSKVQNSQVKREVQRQLIEVLTKNRNNFGKSQLWVEGPISAINAITDLDECRSPDLNDCNEKADCINTYGSFECKCSPGYGDRFERDRRRSGRKCESCNGKTHCNGRGECLIENGQNVCKCAGNYYGSQCDIDGEVLAVAVGASVSALVIIGLTLACLCMWSRRWKKEEQKAAIMSRTLFGGMASQALSYLSKNSMSGGNPYQQHVTLDERLRWAQVTDPAHLNGNIYVNEPMSLHATSPSLMGTSLMETPPMMSARRSADTCDTTIDDLFEERHHMKRPKSRSSQIQNGSIYYDLEGEPQSELYASRQPNLVPYPAQFCVPMNPYPHSRGFYN